MQNKKANSRSEFLFNNRIRMLNSKRSQGWGMDLMIALSIFLVGMVIFYIYSLNNPNEAKENIENLFYDGESLTNVLLSEGYPNAWNSTNVVGMGILSNDKINETKLERFYDLSQTEYERTKILFNTKYDYYFFLDEDMIINSIPVEGIGKPGTTKINIDAINLIKVTRVTIYKNKPINAYLYIWEE
jgi:hypothetical protein